MPRLVALSERGSCQQTSCTTPRGTVAESSPTDRIKNPLPIPILLGSVGRYTQGTRRKHVYIMY